MVGKAALTPTEAAVLELVLEGLSDQEIADRRFVSIKTVQTHVSRLLQKHDCRNRTQLVAKVLRRSNPDPRGGQGISQMNRLAEQREWPAPALIDDEEAKAWNHVALALPPDAERQDRRADVERVVSAVRAVGGGAVVLWGESGNGKSWLARAVAEELASQSGVPGALIRVGANRTNPRSVYATDLLSVITLSRQDARTWSTTGLEAGVRSLLQSTACPFSVLVLDDATPADLDRIMPATSTVPVIVTMRMPAAGRMSVRIDPFSAEESLTYLMATLPQVTSEDAAKLSRMLGYRPLALAAVQGVVNAQILGLAALIDSMAEDVAEAIESVERLTSSPDVRTLRSVYAIIAQQIDADARDGPVLDALTWTVGEGPTLRQDLMYQVYGIAQRAAAHEVALAAALHRLDRLGLVTQRDDVIEMNELTRSILRAIRVEQSTSALERLKRNLLDSQVPVEHEKVMNCSALLWREEYRTVRDSMTEVLGDDRELGLLCIDSRTWFLASSDGVWREDGPLSAGCYLIDVSPTDIRIVHAGTRSSTTRDQATAITAISHVYAGLIRATLYADQEPGPRFSLAIEPPDGLRHSTIGFGSVESAIAEGRTVWTVCGRRFVPTTQRRDLPNCFACDALGGDPAWTREMATKISELLILLQQFARPSARLHAQLEATYAWVEFRKGESERAEAFSASAVTLLTRLEPHDCIPYDVVADIVAKMPTARPLAMKCLETFGEGLLNEITAHPAWSHQWVSALSKYGHSDAAGDIVASFPTVTYSKFLDRSNFSSDGALHWALADYNRERSRFDMAEGEYWLSQSRADLAKAAFARACLVSSACGKPLLRRAVLELYAALFPDDASEAYCCSFCGGTRDSDDPYGNSLNIICSTCLRKSWSEASDASGFCTFCQSNSPSPVMKSASSDAQICEQCFGMLSLWARLEVRPRSQAIIHRRRTRYSTLSAEHAKREREHGTKFAARLYQEDRHGFALRILEHIADAASDDPDAHANLGFGLVPFDTARSQYHLRRSLALGFRHPEIAVLNLGLSFARSGMLDVARSLLRGVAVFDESTEPVMILWDPAAILTSKPEPRILQGTDVRTVARHALRVLRSRPAEDDR